jgi:hypothetical protein
VLYNTVSTSSELLTLTTYRNSTSHTRIPPYAIHPPHPATTLAVSTRLGMGTRSKSV